MAFALYQSGALKRHSNIAAADKQLRHGLRLSRELGDQWLASRILRQLGIIAAASGDYEDSKKFYEENLAMRKVLGDREGLARAYWQLAFIAAYRGDFEQGERLFLECYAILSQSNELASIAKGHDALGWGCFWTGKFAQFKASRQQSLAIYQELGATLQVAFATAFLGMALRHLGEYEQAYAIALEAVELNRQIGPAALARTSHALTMASGAASGVGEYEEAKRFGEIASLGYETVGHKQRLGEPLVMRAHASYGLGDFPATRRLILETLKIIIEVHNSFPILVALLLAEEGHINRAMQIKTLAWKIPLVANSRWLNDVAGRKLESLAASMPPGELAAARAKGESLDLWETAAELLEELPRLGWG